MKESNFANEFKVSCDAFQCFYYKIPDAYNMQRFSPKKPFDAFMIVNGHPICLEFKIHKKRAAFPFNRVADHQIEGLWKAKRNGASAFIIINVRIGREYNRAHYIDTYVFSKTKDMSERKSIPFDRLIELPYLERIPAPSGKGRVWDVMKLVNGGK